MGGCRCTYRNCTVKSDGKTHMFHYPVFEKVRCHQWLINAHRLEFLDLKLSQLKNRVVCQHHFKDENFMNFKKDKLTFDAIPTEDGPYCDASKYVHLNPESSKLFSIIIEDIENDYNDKKANYSVKYGDFLANLDLMDIEKIDEDNTSYKNTYNTNLDDLTSHKSRDKSGIFNDDNSFLFNIALPDKSDKKNVITPTLAVSPYVSGADVNDLKSYPKSKSNFKHISGVSDHNALVTKAVVNLTPKQQLQPIEKQHHQQNQQIIQQQQHQQRMQQLQLQRQHNQQLLQKQQQQKEQQLQQRHHQQLLQQQQQQQQQQEQQHQQEQQQQQEQYQQQLKHEQQQKQQKKETKVRILSEKKVTDPVSITGKFELVSPNFVLNVAKRKMNLNNTSNNISGSSKIEEISEEDKKETVEIELTPFKEDDPKLEQAITLEKLPHDSYLLENSSKLSVIKPRVPPERVEAINKKREFNMKLRDMVENCLDKLDNCNKTVEQSKSPKHNKIKVIKRKNQQLKSIPKHTPILNPQEYTIAFLEARMRKMENTLLEKIEQNSIKICDLKNTFVKYSPGQSVSQPKTDEETHKKQLFQEIAKYLSPSSKSLIYEELFINKFSPNESTTSPKRKRRRRK